MSFFLFSSNSDVIWSGQPDHVVDGLVCVCHTDPLNFGEGQSHCGQDCNNRSDRLDWRGGAHL